MTRVEFAPEVVGDLDRILQHLHDHELAPADASARILAIVHAFDALQHNPLIGRPAGNDKRELVIGRDAQGYVALYRYVAAIDTAYVLAIRGQREAGYVRP